MSAYSTTGQAFSPLRRAASISSTRCVTRSSITAKTCSTVRPEASMRRRSADLIARVAALRSSGVLSHVGNGGSFSGCLVTLLDHLVHHRHRVRS